MSYDQIAHWVDSIAAELRSGTFSSIVAILRGGAFPGLFAAFATGRQIFFIKYDRPTQTASWQGDIPPPGKVLLCDDLAGLGHTLVNSAALLEKTHPNYEVLTVVSDELSRLHPKWSMSRPNVLTVLPWEREVVSTRYQSDWLAGGAGGALNMRPDPEYRLWAVDLDGILCEDIPRTEYEQDLLGTLSRRDQLARAENAFSLNHEEHVIVTGRPKADFERTRAWLDHQGYHGIEAHHRDAELYSDKIEDVAAFKVERATALGATDFLESCPIQAVHIACLAPHIRVYWWRSGSPILINARPATIG